MTEQLTFTEQEAQKLADFFNFVFNRATWNGLNSKDVVKLTGHYNFMHSFQKKVDDHIMELKEVLKPPKPPKLVKKPKAKK